MADRRNRSPMANTNIAVCDDFLRAEDQQAVWQLLKAGGWVYGGYSDQEPGASRYFYKHFTGYRQYASEAFDPQRGEQELREASSLLAGLWDVLKNGPLKGHVLSRCYANGMPAGVEGGLHLDS